MKGALTRCRVMAYVVGVTLLVFAVLIVLKYTTDNTQIDKVESWVAVVHGWLYFIYLITIVDLARRVRFSINRIVLTALAGMVPFLSFVMERRVTADVEKLLVVQP